MSSCYARVAVASRARSRESMTPVVGCAGNNGTGTGIPALCQVLAGIFCFDRPQIPTILEGVWLGAAGRQTLYFASFNV